MTGPHVDQAVAALIGNAQRLRASAASQSREEARERELTDGLEHLAPSVAHDADEFRRPLGQPAQQGGSAVLRARRKTYSAPCFEMWDDRTLTVKAQCFNDLDALVAQYKRDAALGCRVFGIDGKDGTGKSTLATEVCARLSWPLLSIDTLLTTKAGEYVKYIEYAKLKAFVASQSGPAIVEGVCLLEVAEHAEVALDRHTYVKRISSAGRWDDEDICDFDEPAENVIHRWNDHAKRFAQIESGSGAGQSLAEDDEPCLFNELIRYHGKFKPARRADYIFENTENEIG